MGNCLCAAIDMPLSYSLMDEEEMTYVEGGETIDYNFTLATKVGASVYAASYRANKG